MQLVERDRAEILYGAMEGRTQAAGGSVANTLAGIGKLGLRTGFVGRVHDDALGRFYAQAMKEDATRFVNPPVAGGELPTSRSMIFVSPDGERSMNTYLGISAELGLEDEDLDIARETFATTNRVVTLVVNVFLQHAYSRRSSLLSDPEHNPTNPILSDRIDTVRTI